MSVEQGRALLVPQTPQGSQGARHGRSVPENTRQHVPVQVFSGIERVSGEHHRRVLTEPYEVQLPIPNAQGIDLYHSAPPDVSTRSPHDTTEL